MTAYALEPPYLIFLGSARDALAAKTGQGIVDWRPEWALGQLRLPDCRADLGIPDLSLEAAVEQGARTLVLGTVGPGGVLPESWVDLICRALALGLDVASGLHTRLGSFPAVAAAAARHGRRLVDVRHSDVVFQTGNGRKRPGLRVLTVGTDCSVGKKYTALTLERELQARGVPATFCATGQTGVLIAGRGVAIDAVAADFISGAAEWLTPATEPDHWQVVEGQGSLFHPSFAGVSLGLLHGAQPDAFVVCHEPTRQTMRNVDTPVPSIQAVIDATLSAGRLTNPAIRCCGLAVNTSSLDEAAGRTLLERLADEHGVPATDPVRFGVAALVTALLGS